MSLISELQAQVVALQAKITLLQSIPEDTFSLGTIMLFSAPGNVKWYYVKTAEETWVAIDEGFTVTEERQLREWIALAKESSYPNFEVYKMSPAVTPFYATA